MRAKWLLAAILIVAISTPMNAVASHEENADAPGPDSDVEDAPEEPSQENATEPAVPSDEEPVEEDGSNETEPENSTADNPLLDAADLIEALANDPQNESLLEMANELPEEVQDVVDAVLNGCQAVVEATVPFWSGTMTDRRHRHLDVVEQRSLLVVEEGREVTDALEPVFQMVPLRIVVDWDEGYWEWEPATVTVRVPVPAGQEWLDSGTGVLAYECGEDAPFVEFECGPDCAVGIQPRDGWRASPCSFNVSVLTAGDGTPGSPPGSLLVAPAECIARINQWIAGLTVPLRLPAMLPTEATVSFEPAPVATTVDKPTQPEPENHREDDGESLAVNAGADRVPDSRPLTALVAAAPLIGAGVVTTTLVALRRRG